MVVLIVVVIMGFENIVFLFMICLDYRMRVWDVCIGLILYIGDILNVNRDV